MRDFEQDIIAAARFGHPLTGAYFSWSLLRHNLFLFCPRAYFIRYYLAQGGWNIHSHELTQYAYFEKHLPTRSLWLESAMEKAVTDSLKTCRGDRKEFLQSLSRNLTGQLRKLQSSLENESWMTDPKLPGLLEVFHFEKDTADIEALVESLVPELRALCVSFLPVLRNQSLHFPDWRLDEPFLQFRHGIFPVWLHGGLRFLDRDRTVMVRFSAGTDEHFLLEAALWRKYHPGGAFLVCPSDGGESFFVRAENDPPLDEFIDGSSSAMLSLIHPDGTVRLSDFPKDTSDDRCTSCRFRRTCHTIGYLSSQENSRNS